MFHRRSANRLLLGALGTLVVVGCRSTPPEPEPPLTERPPAAEGPILAARHAFAERVPLPAPFDGALVASGNGARFAIRLTDGAVHVHDADGTPQFVVRGVPGASRVLAWADNGQRIAIGGTERVTVFDVDAKRRLAEWEVDALQDAVLSPRGASLVVSAGDTVTWYDAATGDVRWSAPHGGGPLAFLSGHEAVVASDGTTLRRFDRLGGLQAEAPRPDLVRLAASEAGVWTIDARGRSTVLAVTDLSPLEGSPWSRRLLRLAPGPEDHWFVDGLVIDSALAGEAEATYVDRNAEAGAFVVRNGQLGLWLVSGDHLEPWSLWRPPRITPLPLPSDVDAITHVGALPGGPFVMGSDDGRVWGVAADALDRVAFTASLPDCSPDPDLGCTVLDVGGAPDELEVATQQVTYETRPRDGKAKRIARLGKVRGAQAMPDGRWVSWDRDAVRVGARAGRGRKVGPPLDIPRAAVAGGVHAVVWDSAIVVRDARGQPIGERWPVPYDALPTAMAVAPDGNVVAAAFAGEVQLFFVESGFAQIVQPPVDDVHALTFDRTGTQLWAIGQGVTRIAVNQARAIERWSLAGGSHVDAAAVHPDLGRLAVVQHGDQGPSVVVLPPR